jgi:hypothetical protein
MVDAKEASEMPVRLELGIEVARINRSTGCGRCQSGERVTGLQSRVFLLLLHGY